MSHLTVATYNTYGERNGRDPALDALLREPQTLVCLQEVSLSRAWEIKRSFAARSFVSPVRYGLQFLAVVLPKNARFEDRHAVQLNSHTGLLPEAWCLRRGYHLYRSGRSGWIDALEPRAAQTALVLWEGRAFRLINTHLPYEVGLNNRCLMRLQGLIGGEEDVLLAGDLNTTTETPFLADLLRATGLQPAGPNAATHDMGSKIDHVLFREGFRETGYSLQESLSDHRLVRVGLEA